MIKWIFQIYIDLLISQKNDIKINKDKQEEVDIQIRVNPLNVFYTIHLMKISRFKYTSMMHREMQKMGISRCSIALVMILILINRLYDG
jgi:hypothetical protein